MQENTSFIVFIQFFAILNIIMKKAGLSSSKHINVHAFFMNELNVMGLHAKELKVIDAFFKRPIGILELEIKPSDTELKKSIQSLYEFLCNIIGPVDTDKLFGNTIEKVSKSRAAQVYPPQKLL